jgi:hypothetical protein
MSLDAIIDDAAAELEASLAGPAGDRRLFAVLGGHLAYREDARAAADPSSSMAMRLAFTVVHRHEPGHVGARFVAGALQGLSISQMLLEYGWPRDRDATRTWLVHLLADRAIHVVDNLERYTAAPDAELIRERLVEGHDSAEARSLIRHRYHQLNSRFHALQFQLQQG